MGIRRNMCGPPERESSAERLGVPGSARRACDPRRDGEWLDGDLNDLYHRFAEVSENHSGCQGIVGGTGSAFAEFWNSPRDWSGSKRTGNPIVLPVVEAANKL